MLWVLNVDGKFIYVSRAFAEFVGIYGNNSIFNGSLSDLIHPANYSEIEKALVRSTTAAGAFSVVIRIRRPYGSYSWCELGVASTVSPIDGTVLGFFGHTKPLDEAPQDLPGSGLLAVSHVANSAEASFSLLDSAIEHLIAAREIMNRSDQKAIVSVLDIGLILAAKTIYNTTKP